MTAGQHIDYDALALEALRGVIKACLAQVAQSGLVGEHHFYIAFNTQAPGVILSKRLKEKYPLEMTIVLQHRFWDLAVEDERFEVKLTFDGIPERLVVPYKAVKVFYDPSVPYVLQFEEVEAAGQADGRRPGRKPGSAPAGDTTGRDMAARETNQDRRRPLKRGRSEGEEALPRPPEPVRRSSEETPRAPVAPAAALPPQKPAVVAAATADGSAAPEEGEKPADNGAKIFDLSKFRGKK